MLQNFITVFEINKIKRKNNQILKNDISEIEPKFPEL